LEIYCLKYIYLQEELQTSSQSSSFHWLSMFTPHGNIPVRRSFYRQLFWMYVAGGPAPVRTRAFQLGCHQLWHTLIFTPLQPCSDSGHVQTPGLALTTAPPLGHHDSAHVLSPCGDKEQGGTPRSAARSQPTTYLG